MLLQASKLYTPIIFETFQEEYERSLAVCTKALNGTHEYLVGDFTYKEEYQVIGDPLKQIVVCNCRQFNRIGILCSHALKVLDLMNIKSLPPQYVLKRWTREARSGVVQDNQGRKIIKNPKMYALLRFRFLSHKFLNLAHRAANFPECDILVDNTLDILDKQIESLILEDKVNASPTIFEDSSTAPSSANPPIESLINARLKKKNVQVRSSKRKRAWLDKKKARKGRETQDTTSVKREMV
jgi:hypothetical protein